MASEKKRQSVRSNRVCFTLNFKGETTWPTSALEEVTSSLSASHQAGALRYAIVGKEVAPTTGTPHLQGFINMQPTALRASDGTVGAWKKLFPFLARAHLETARGTDSANNTYCSKDAVFLELGTPQQKRTLAEFSTLPLTEQLTEDPEMALKSRFQLDSISKKLRMSTLMEKVLARHHAMYVAPSLKPWQASLLEALRRQTTREVFFVIDTIGNTGKSHLAQYMANHPDYNACVFGVGKKADLAFAFVSHFLEKENEYTVFDLTRCFGEETWPFGFIEECKTGRIISGKYESTTLPIYPQKVVVFCNKEPENMKLSLDRVVKYFIDFDNKLITL